jgi:hypothetical protein
MLSKIFNREKFAFPVAIVMLAISLFCVFLCIDGTAQETFGIPCSLEVSFLSMPLQCI